MKYLLVIVLIFLVKLSFCSGFGNTTQHGLAKNYLLAPDSSVRKSVLKIKGKPVDRQVYFNYIKCKHCRSQLIGSSVFIGIGAIALAGSIPLLLRANHFDTSMEQVYGAGGIVLANLGVFGLCIGIPFTIKNLKEYKTRFGSKCNYQTVYLFPKLNGFAFTCKF